MDVNEELKFWGKFTKKKNLGGGRWPGSGWVGGQGGCQSQSQSQRLFSINP